VRVVSGQHLKFNAANGQSLKISVVNGQNAKRAGQIFDLAVAAVTIESMGVTPPGYYCNLLLMSSIWLP